MKEPVIPEETKNEMVKFFLKTSIPRIIAEKIKRRGENEENSN